MTLNTEQEGALRDLAAQTRDHFEQIEQSVPNQSFLVGGAVRDAVMGVEPNDLDFVVVGETPESMEERGFEHVDASSFPIFHDSEHEEWALARTEEKDGEGYTGFEVFTDDVSLREDLERRDLCLNAMALSATVWSAIDGIDHPVEHDWLVPVETDTDTVTPILADPHGGVEDAEQGVLRHVSEAFAEDPLRVLRVARYAARFAVPTDEAPVEFHDMPDRSVEEVPHQFASKKGNVMLPGFHVADETEDMMRQVAPELNRMSRDRIGTEIRKAMAQSRRPSRFFEVLRDSGALSVLWPELDRATQVPAGPPEHHYESAYMFED